MVWQIAGSVPSECNYVWDNYTYYDCLVALMVRKYDAYAQEKMMKAKYDQ